MLTGKRDVGVVLLLCGAFVALCSWQARSTSATYDEVAHLPAGYSYLLWNDYRLNPEHPPLVKELAALPLLAMKAWPHASASDAAGPDEAGRRLLGWHWNAALRDPEGAQWYFGHLLLYGLHDSALRRVGQHDPLRVPTTVVLDKADFRNDAERMLAWARAIVTALAVLLGVLVYCWSRELFGAAGGALALAIYCFNPSFIAHASLVTTDVGVSLFMFGAVYGLWRALRRLTALNVTATALSFALAFVTKFSAVVLVPIFVAIGLFWIFGDGERTPSRARRALALLGLLAACALAATVVTWAAYGFRFTAAAPTPQAPGAEAPRSLPIAGVVRRTDALRAVLERHPGTLPAGDVLEREVAQALATVPQGAGGRVILFARDHHLLPEAYLYGIAATRMKSLFRRSFVLGRISDRGSWTYFPATFLLKTPLPTLAAVATAIFLAIRRRMSWSGQAAFLATPVVLYMTVSMAGHLNIGHRHLMPVHPFLFVACGALASGWQDWARARKAWVAALALTTVAASSLVVLAPPWRPQVVAPHFIAYFNELAGGPREGHRALVDSNLDWGQDLVALAEWLESRGIAEPVNLCYFGMADPRRYGFPHVALPGNHPFEPSVRGTRRPTLDDAIVPGYVAISATNLQGVYSSDDERAAWKRFLEGARLVDTVGYSIFIFHVEKRPG